MGSTTALNLISFPSYFPSTEAIISVVFTLIFLWWVIYTAVATYHWFRYGRSSWIAVPALAVHLMISGAIFVYMTAGLQ